MYLRLIRWRLTPSLSAFYKLKTWLYFFIFKIEDATACRRQRRSCSYWWKDTMRGGSIRQWVWHFAFWEILIIDYTTKVTRVKKLKAELEKSLCLQSYILQFAITLTWFHIPKVKKIKVYLLNQLSSNLDRWEALKHSNKTQVAFQVPVPRSFD